MKLMWVRAAIVAGAALAALAPLPPAWVESWYSTRAYVALQRVVTPAANAVPFVLLDVFIAVVATAWVVLAWRDLTRGRRLRAVVRILARSIVWASIAYLVFLITWGFNYRRRHFPEKLPYDETAVTEQTAVATARVTVDRLNSLHSGAHAAGWPAPDAADPDLAAAFARSLRALGLPPSIAVARPKRSVLDWYFRRSGTAGMTDPYFLETIAASALLPVERPFPT